MTNNEIVQPVTKEMLKDVEMFNANFNRWIVPCENNAFITEFTTDNILTVRNIALLCNMADDVIKDGKRAVCYIGSGYALELTRNERNKKRVIMWNVDKGTRHKDMDVFSIHIDDVTDSYYKVSFYEPDDDGDVIQFRYVYKTS